MGSGPEGGEDYTLGERLLAGLAYACVSVGIQYANKFTLTVFQFPSPSLLGLSQIVCTILFIVAYRNARDLGIKPLGWDTARAIMPLPPVQLANILSGLVGMKYVSLPMFGALRHFGLSITIVAEYYAFGKARGPSQLLAIGTICAGALVAANTDLSFSVVGYSATMVNNIATTWVGVMNKQKAEANAELGGGAWGVLFFSNIIFLPMMIAYIAVFNRDEVIRALAYGNWQHAPFLICFSLSSILGCVLQYTTVWSQKVNGPLTTSVVGCLKNVLTAYGGMAMVDFTFEPWHFAGITISVLGGLAYTGVEIWKLWEPRPPPRDVEQPDAEN